MTSDPLPSLGDYNGQFVHPRLAVGGCPFPKDVPAFVRAGIRGIVDARSAYLKEHVIYIASLPDSIHWRLVGSWDGYYPNPTWTGLDSRAPAHTAICPVYAEFMVEQTMQVVRDYSPALIHCGGGIGRSGNLAAIAYAALENIPVGEAVERMRAYRPAILDWNWYGQRYPDTDVQRLVDLARHILGTQP